MRTTSGLRRRASVTASRAVRGFADNFHVLFGLEDHAEARTDEGLIVDDEDAGAHAGTTGSFARRR